jgi:hypothetical protein
MRHEQIGEYLKKNQKVTPLVTFSLFLQLFYTTIQLFLLNMYQVYIVSTVHKL